MFEKTDGEMLLTGNPFVLSEMPVVKINQNRMPMSFWIGKESQFVEVQESQDYSDIAAKKRWKFKLSWPDPTLYPSLTGCIFNLVAYFPRDPTNQYKF